MIDADGGRENEIDDDQWGDLSALCAFLGVTNRRPVDVPPQLPPLYQLSSSSPLQFVASPSMITFLDNCIPPCQPILLMPTAMVSGTFSGYAAVPQWSTGLNHPVIIPQPMPFSAAPSFLPYWSPIPPTHPYIASPPPPPPSIMFPVSAIMHRQSCNSSHGQKQGYVGGSRTTVNLSSSGAGLKEKREASKNNSSSRMESGENGKGRSGEEILATICSDSTELRNSATSATVKENRTFKPKLPTSLELKPSFKSGFPVAPEPKPNFPTTLGLKARIPDAPRSPDPDESPIAHSLLAGALSVDRWRTNTKSLWPSRAKLGAVTGFSNSMPVMASIWTAGADDAALLDSADDANTSTGSSSDEENDAVFNFIEILSKQIYFLF